MPAVNEQDAACGTGVLHTLLRGHLAAVESYSLAIGKIEDQRILQGLQAIRDDHSRAVQLLRKQLGGRGEQAVANPGPWAAMSAASTGEDGILSPATILAALIQGEQQSVIEHEDVLKKDELNSECLSLVRGVCLANARKHIEELNRLMGVQ
jgi:hypothetical protein